MCRIVIAPRLDATTAGTVPAQGVVLHYTVHGRGAPVLLLAGGPGMSGDYMLPIAEQLGDYRTIVLDQRGTGRSTMERLEPATMTLALAVDDVERLRVHWAWRPGPCSGTPGAACSRWLTPPATPSA